MPLPNNFTFTKTKLNTNAKENGEDIIRCDYTVRVKDPRYNPIKVTLSIYCPKETLYKDINGKDLYYKSEAINTINYNTELNGWLGFKKNHIQPLPGTHTYYARLGIISGRTRAVEAVSDYIPFTMTGKQQNSQAQQTSVQQNADVREITEQDITKPEVPQPLKMPQQKVSPTYVATSQSINIKAGVRVTMQAVNELAVADANEGDLIDFIVTDDVMANGLIAIPKGSVGKAEVVKVSDVSALSQTESMQISPSYILLPNNEGIPLKKKKFEIKGASAGWSSMGRRRGLLKKGYSIRCEVASNTNVLAYSKVSEQEQIAPIKKSTLHNTDVNSPITGSSDVDLNIPNTCSITENTFAVIIANENYASESQVEYAINDGRAFKEYCRNTLGLPDLNIHYNENATKNNIIAEIDWLSKVAAAFGSDAKIIIYYAGHGIPDETTSDAYLLPVDGIGTNVKTGYALSNLYEQLSVLPASSVTVLIDACFSGTKRGEGMLANARSVAIKAKAPTPKGNLIVFSATQGDETAYPYKEKGHGLFTYYLLKKLQETKGAVDYGTLGDYINKEVSRKSILVNNKPQTPTVTFSPALSEKWRGLTLK